MIQAMLQLVMVRMLQVIDYSDDTAPSIVKLYSTTMMSILQMVTHQIAKLGLTV